MGTVARETKRDKIYFSPSRIVTFLPIQKTFGTSGAKMRRFSGRMWQKTSQVTKNIFVCESVTFFLALLHCLTNGTRHINCVLARNVTKVTRCIVCHRKKWRMWRNSPKSETGIWEEIRLSPPLSICVYVYVCVCTHVFSAKSEIRLSPTLCLCACTCMYVCVCMFFCVNVCLCVCVCVCVFVFARELTWLYKCRSWLCRCVLRPLR